MIGHLPYVILLVYVDHMTKGSGIGPSKYKCWKEPETVVNSATLILVHPPSNIIQTAQHTDQKQGQKVWCNKFTYPLM